MELSNIHFIKTKQKYIFNKVAPQVNGKSIYKLDIKKESAEKKGLKVIKRIEMIDTFCNELDTNLTFYHGTYY